MKNLPAEITKGAVEAVENARKLRVDSKPTYDFALELEKGCKLFQQKIKEWFKSKKEKAHSLWKEICEDEKTALADLVEEEKILRSKRAKWYRLEETKRIEKQRKADEKARREAEAERQQKLKELQRQQQIADAEEKAELKAEAAELKAEPIVYKAPEIKNRAVGSGASFRKQYYAEVVDIEKVPRQFMVVDMKRLNKMAQANEGENPPAGVVFEYKDIPVTR